MPAQQWISILCSRACPREIEDRLHDRPVGATRPGRVSGDVVKRQFQMPLAAKRAMTVPCMIGRQQRQQVEPAEISRNNGQSAERTDVQMLCAMNGHVAGFGTENCSLNLRQPMTTPVRLNTNPKPHNMTINALRNVGRADNAGKSIVCSAL